MADKGRPKNLTTVLSEASGLKSMRSKDVENLHTLIIALNEEGIQTFAQLWLKYPELGEGTDDE